MTKKNLFGYAHLTNHSLMELAEKVSASINQRN